MGREARVKREFSGVLCFLGFHLFHSLPSFDSSIPYFFFGYNYDTPNHGGGTQHWMLYILIPAGPVFPLLQHRTLPVCRAIPGANNKKFIHYTVSASDCLLF